MNFWPFSRTEERSANYSDLRLEQLLASAAGGTVANRMATAALETGAGLIARSFSTAQVDSSPAIQAALKPELLSLIARSMIRTGDLVLLIETGSGSPLELLPACNVSLTGSALPSSWVYKLSLGGPSATTTHENLDAASVIHLRYAVEPAKPHVGLGPLQIAHLSGSLSAELEQALAQEAKTPTGQVIAVPDAGDTDADGNSPTYAGIEKVLKGLAGKLALLAGGDFGDLGGHAATWRVNRLGMNPPAAVVDLKTAIHLEILGCIGVPIGMVNATAAGSARESYSQFLHTTISPLARIVESELSEKLEQQVDLRFSELRAADVMSKARAVKSLTDERMSLAEALRVAGLE